MRIFPKKIFSQIASGFVAPPVDTTQDFFKVFQSAPGGMCFSTHNSIVIEANENFTQLFGYTRNEFVGMNIRLVGIINEEESQHVKKILKENGKLVNYELKCRHKNGQTIFCLLNASQVTLNGIPLILTSFNDISTVKKQNQRIEVEHKDLFDSVNYAKRIQDAMLPSQELIEKVFPQSFVLFKPKAIVSGDFYWIETRNGKTYVAVADCTGHGVPGALLSIVGYNLLNESLKKRPDTKPGDILDSLSCGVYKMLRQNSSSWCVKDGMEVSVISYDRENNILEYAGARRPLYIVRQNELLKSPADRFPIGFHTGQHLQSFSNYSMHMKKGDTLYMFSDGYSNQFGGTKNKKFSVLQFQQTLLAVNHLKMQDQKKILNDKLENWMGSEQQIDDILVLGIKL